jgi:hypothetical protein
VFPALFSRRRPRASGKPFGGFTRMNIAAASTLADDPKDGRA